MKSTKNLLPGFSLIEIIVALLIGSMLIVSLYQVLMQTYKAVGIMNRVIDVDMPLVPMYNQLERDLLGMVVPPMAQESKNEKQTDKPEGKKTFSAFNSSGRNKSLALSFITTGGFKSVDSTGSILPAPYVKRVFYSIEPDKDQPDLFVLWYGQSENLDIQAKPSQKYELAWQIKELQVITRVYEPPAADEKQPSGPGKLITLDEFNAQEVLEKYKTSIPAFVEIKGILANAQGTHSQQFTALFALAQYPEYKLPAKPSPATAKNLAYQKAESAANGSPPLKVVSGITPAKLKGG